MKLEKYIKKLEDHDFGVKVDGGLIRISFMRHYDKSQEVLEFETDATYFDDAVVNKDNLMILNIEALCYLMHNTWKYIKTPLEKRFSGKKYTINVLGGDDMAFLNIATDDGGACFTDYEECSHWQTHFTKREIEELKQRDDIAIDWDKAIIEEAPQHED